MNDKVEEGQFMISINTQPVFADGKSEGDTADREQSAEPLSDDREDLSL